MEREPGDLPGPKPVRVLEPELAGDLTSRIGMDVFLCVGWDWCGGSVYGVRVNVLIFKLRNFLSLLEVTEACAALARS
jgi:hypothetical protein